MGIWTKVPQDDPGGGRGLIARFRRNIQRYWESEPVANNQRLGMTDKVTDSRERAPLLDCNKSSTFGDSSTMIEPLADGTGVEFHIVLQGEANVHLEEVRLVTAPALCVEKNQHEEQDQCDTYLLPRWDVGYSPKVRYGFRSHGHPTEHDLEGRGSQQAPQGTQWSSLYAFLDIKPSFNGQRGIGGRTTTEKPILEYAAPRRYVGLYPHSADPPLQYTQSPVPEYHHNNRATTYSLPFIHRPTRNPRVNITSPLAESLLSWLLQVVKVVARIVLRILSALGIAYLGRIFWQRINRHLKTTSQRHQKETTSKMSDPDTLVSIIATQFFDTYINQDHLIDPERIPDSISDIYSAPEMNSVPPHTHIINSPPPIFADSPFYFTESMNFAVDTPRYIPETPQPVFHPEDWALNLGIFDIGNSNIDLYQFSAQTIVPLDPDWGEFLNLSRSPTPAEGTPPGLSNSMNVSPQTEGLETPPAFSPHAESLASPTFTQRSSPVSESPPPPLSSPKHICGWESCGHKEFDRPCDLNKHLKTHLKNFACDAAGCERKFSTEKDRKRHVNTVHHKLKPNICTLCVEQGAVGAFSRPDNMKDHQKRVHGISD